MRDPLASHRGVTKLGPASTRGLISWHSTKSGQWSDQTACRNIWGGRIVGWNDGVWRVGEGGAMMSGLGEGALVTRSCRGGCDDV